MDAQREMETEADIGHVQIQTCNLLDSLKAVKHRVSMDVEQTGSLFGAAFGIEERFQRSDQLTAMPFVVFDQTLQCFIVERVQFREMLRREDEPVDTQVLEPGDHADAGQPATHGQGLSGFLM